MLTHSKLHEIPNDFICDDRKSLTVLDLHHMGYECVDTHRPVSLCYDATLEKVPDSLGS